MTDMTVKTPWHLWAVGVISLLWNGYGGYDFIMTTTQGETYMRAAGMTQPMIDYFNAMPTWMYVPWTLGVWGAVLGSILLLLRNRLAVWAFLASLVGAVANLIYLPEAMAMMKWMPWAIVLIAAFLAWYAWSMSKKGVLR
jgi:hypothetical protein